MPDQDVELDTPLLDQPDSVFKQHNLVAMSDLEFFGICCETNSAKSPVMQLLDLSS